MQITKDDDEFGPSYIVRNYDNDKELGICRNYTTAAAQDADLEEDELYFVTLDGRHTTFSATALTEFFAAFLAVRKSYEDERL